MTIAQVLEAARNNLNAVSDTNWSDSELYVSLYQVMLHVARQTRCIEGTDTTVTTVAGTAAYSKPAGIVEIWRVTYDGKRLQAIDYRDYDTINPNSVTTSGTPAFYLLYNDQLILHSTPDDAKTVTIWSYNEPTAIPTAATTLSSVFPSTYHDVLVEGLTYKMCPKDLGHPLTAMFQANYERGVNEIRDHIRKKRRGDRFRVIRTEEQSLITDFGLI